MGETNLIDDEVKKALRSLKPEKRPGYDNISSNVVNENIFHPREIYFQSFVTTGNISRNLIICKSVPNL